MIKEENEKEIEEIKKFLEMSTIEPEVIIEL